MGQMKEISEDIKGLVKPLLKELRQEFHKHYHAECEYGIGYLDCLCEVCRKLGIEVVRDNEDVVFVENDCTTCKHLDIETIYGVCSKTGQIINDIPENCKNYLGYEA